MIKYQKVFQYLHSFFSMCVSMISVLSILLHHFTSIVGDH